MGEAGPPVPASGGVELVPSGEPLFGVADAAVLPGGGFVVANDGSRELVLFDVEGREVRRIGREGDGPGEFRGLGSVQVLPPDTLAVFDRSHQRLNLFTSDGRLVGGGTYLPADARRLGAMRRLTSGRWVARSDDRVLPVRPGEMARDTVSYHAAFVTNGGIERGTALARSGGMMTTSIVLQGRAGAREAAFGPRALWDSYGACLLVMEGDRPLVEVWREGEGKVGAIELPLERRRVAASEVEEWVALLLEEVPSELHPSMERALSEAPRPEFLPLASAVKLDPQGRLWIQEWQPPRGPGTGWWVVDAGMRSMTPLTLPVSGSPFRVMAEGILLGTRGEFGEEGMAFIRMGQGDASRGGVLDRLCRYGAPGVN
jgi:hypothetical protein